MTEVQMSNEDYQKSEGLSFTALKYFAISPAHYKSWISGEIEKKSNPVFTAAHMAILEPERFEQDIFVSQGRQKKADKEANAQAEAQGKFVITLKEYETARKMQESVKRHKIANALCTFGKNERSFFVEHENFDFKMKCRPDILWDDRNLFVDLKGFYDLRIRNIQNQVYRMKYHWQQAWYEDVLKIATGKKWKAAHLFVENAPPYGVRVFSIDEATLDKAREEFYPLLPTYAECKVKDEWPDYSDNIEPVSLPAYAWSQEED